MPSNVQEDKIQKMPFGVVTSYIDYTSHLFILFFAANNIVLFGDRKPNFFNTLPLYQS